MKVKFNGFGHAHGDYYVGRGGSWAVEDIKDLDDKDANALLADFKEAGKGKKPAFVKAS